MAELSAARRGRYDVVIAYPMRYPGYHPRHWVYGLLRRPLQPWAAVTRAFGVSLLRLYDLPIPIVAIDMDDAFTLSRPGLFLLDRAVAFLKRELPADRWQALTGSVHPHIATFRYRNSAKWRARIDNLQPISLPQWMIDPAITDGPFPQKTADLFFAGAVHGNSTLRSDGVKELDRLRAAGVRIDIPAAPLPHSEFQRRMAASWLAWSPAGRGWDCNRHYEAALAQSVPVMNYPTILRHQPLADGVHGVYYAPEPGGLERAVLAALSDKPRLQGMALAARDHVRAHHTRKAYCDYILRLAMQNRTPPATQAAEADCAGPA